MAPMAAISHGVVDPAGQQAGVVQDHDQHAQGEHGDDQDPEPPGAGLLTSSVIGGV